jgi:hypothetical protein
VLPSFLVLSPSESSFPPRPARACGIVQIIQLALAASQDRAIFSFNVADFQRLHSLYMHTGRHHAGAILVRQGKYDVGEVIRRLSRLSAAFEPDQAMDRLEFLNDWG